MNVLVTIPACSHQRPESHVHCRVRDDGVPVLHVGPICAKLRKLRVVVEQDEDQVVTPRPNMSTRAKTKAQIRAKGTTERATTAQQKKRSVQKKIPREFFSPSLF